MKEMWDQRFSGEEYVYGTEPNVFFKKQIQLLKPGKLLLPAEGEGRNAVFAAGLGWKVQAVDISDQGKAKALKLASAACVSIDYSVGDMAAYDFGENVYDAAALIYAHMASEFRQKVHQKIVKSLKPGGYIILEGFTKRQIDNTSGGPKTLDMLYSIELLKEDFQTIEIELLEEVEEYLEQGVFHKGISAMIRLFGKKPL
jgi:SAM-dependent methyltransferase